MTPQNEVGVPCYLLLIDLQFLNVRLGSTSPIRGVGFSVFGLEQVMAFIHSIRAIIGETSTPQPLENNTGVFRTTSSLWLKTFALRMAVITASGHLGSLQNMTTKSTSSLPRMLALIFLPGATLFNFLGGNRESIFRPFFNLFRLNYHSLRHALMIAAGPKLPYSSISLGEFPREVLVPFKELASAAVEYRATPWSWDSSVLKGSRVINILVVLAQAAASLVLKIRRRYVENATLLLDSTNGLYAIIGLMSTFNSLLMMSIGGV